MVKKLVHTLFCLFFFMPAVMAQDPSSSTDLGLKTSPVITFGYIIQLIFSLLIVIAVLYMGARFILPRLNPGGGKGMINILDRKFLDAGSTAYILAVGKKKWLIIIAKGQVAKIDSLEEE